MYGSLTVVGSLDSGRTVAISENGSLAKAQWNFVIGWVILAVADGGGGWLLLLLILWGHGWLIVIGCV